MKGFQPARPKFVKPRDDEPAGGMALRLEPVAGWAAAITRAETLGNNALGPDGSDLLKQLWRRARSRGRRRRGEDRPHGRVNAPEKLLAILDLAATEIMPV